MSIYKREDCPFVYKIAAIEKVVDGDTVDAIFDLGFDVMFRGRVRLLGIDTPESRTRDITEKFYGLLAKRKLKEWVHKAVLDDRDDVEIELRCPEMDSRGKFGRILGEFWIIEPDSETNLNEWLCDNNYAVGYTGKNKKDILAEHMENRKKLAVQGIRYEHL